MGKLPGPPTERSGVMLPFMDLWEGGLSEGRWTKWDEFWYRFGIPIILIAVFVIPLILLAIIAPEFRQDVIRFFTQ